MRLLLNPAPYRDEPGLIQTAAALHLQGDETPRAGGGGGEGVGRERKRETGSKLINLVTN